MDVNAVNATGANTNQVQQNQNSQGQNNNNQGQNDNIGNPPPATPEITDVYEPSGQTYKPDVTRINQMWDEHNQQVESFRRLIEGLLNKQGQEFIAANGWNNNLSHLFNGEMMEVDEATRAAAQEAIGEGGYYSVEETAKRILNFAVALSGGDPSKIDILEQAALKGFEQAEKMWGGQLPEISQRTMDAVRNGFEEWRQSGAASGITLLQQ
jgi:hypothetical protein